MIELLPGDEIHLCTHPMMEMRMIPQDPSHPKIGKGIPT